MQKLTTNDYRKWELLLLVLSGELPEQAAEFQKWLSESKANEELYLSLKDENSKDALRFDKELLFRKISESLQPKHHFEKQRTPIRRLWLGLLRYASIIILVLGLSVTLLWLTNDELPADALSGAANTIEVGSKKAKLVLENGTTLDLTQDFSLKHTDGTVITNQADGVRYDKEAVARKPQYHTIEVPYGGEYALTLSDGTKVHLNSGTRLTYPSFFQGAERKVELTGEAYFEVTPDDAPFIVHTNDIKVRVLGTAFNVNAYEQDANVNTTLVNGKVEVINKEDDRVYELAPGYNLNYQKKSRTIETHEVDVELYTAWVRGEFLFENQPLGDILVQLSRWYDFNIEYADASIQEMEFTGGAEKRRPIGYLLNQIEQVTNIKFKKDGKTIVAYK